MLLRPYQDQMLQEARGHMRAGKRRVLLQLATGGGKTALASYMIDGAAAKGLRSSFNVHRKELIEQTSRAFDEYGIGHGVIGAGWPFNPHELVTIAGIATLARRLEHVLPPNMNVWDECHHLAAAIWRAVFDAFPDAYQLGLSATPERLDGRGLADFFDVMVSGPSTADLIGMGYLSRYRYFAPGKPDLVGMPTRCGDFNRSDLGDLMDKPKLIGDVVEHYLRLAAGELGVVFAVNREHSRHLAMAFKSEGIAAAHVDGSMSDGERSRAVDAFRAGDVRVLCNVDLFGEGFDLPAIVYAGLARPTKSLALFLQQVGRSLRILPGKEHAIIADHAGNAFNHGLPDDRRTWSLEGRKARTGKSAPTDATSIHSCPTCYRVTYSQVRDCPGCGYEFPVRDRSPAWERGELFLLEKVAERKKKEDAEARLAEERACSTAEDFIELARRRGYKNPAGWASLQLDKRTGRFFARRRRFAKAS